MFVAHPQLYVTMVLCQKMEPNEAIGLSGFRKYFKVKGYSNTTELDGLEKPEYKYDQHNECLEEFIIAIDASYADQYTQEVVLRDITKAYAGFSCFEKESSTIVTGNWGCGAFGGNVHHKLIIQLIAATLARKTLIYCPFGKKKELIETLNMVSNLSVSEASKLLMEYEQITRS